MDILRLALINTDWHAFGSYLIATALVFAFAIIASVFIVFIREYNFKYAWIQWLLLAIWVVLLILFVAFVYATFGPRMFMRWN